jgi:hypothetical protein
MNADNPSRRRAAMIDRKPLKREACRGRGTGSRLSVASPAGPRRRRLASWDEPTHDRPSGAGNWGISDYISCVTRLHNLQSISSDSECALV